MMLPLTRQAAAASFAALMSRCAGAFKGFPALGKIMRAMTSRRFIVTGPSVGFFLPLTSTTRRLLKSSESVARPR